MARIDPINRTGTGGVDLLSQNFNWSLGLVGLKGRGLDLGLSLSYNSLSMWTRSNNDVTYNVDQDWPAPGFRLGFPVVQGPYNHSSASTLFYILITPSGQHVELRRVGTSDVYEAVDASYAQLTKHGSGTSTYFTYLAQGAQLTFEHNPGYTEYHCTEIIDRNGNYISVSYDSSTGNIDTVTDTLGRVITFHYDSYHNIQSITQPWGSATHTWASFGWTTTTIGSSIFSGKTYTGPTKGGSISVLSQVGLPDGSKYTFDYDGSYAMVSAIKYYAPDDNPTGTRHERRQVTYGYDTSGGGCPRVNSEKDWAENWNGDTNGVPATSEEVETTFSQSSGVGTMTMPDSTVYREFYGSTWKSGLVTMTKNYATTSAASSDSDSSPTWKKKTLTNWTQADENISYPINPRVTQSEIWDSESNYRKTTLDYSNSTYAAYSLPYIVKEYDTNGSTVLRSTYTNYDLSSTYTDKRIIGLVTESRVEDSGGVQSKTTYEHDTTTIGSDPLNTTHHYSSYSTTTPRGNVTSVSRWDATDPNTSSKKHTTQMTYDAAGSLLTSTDPLSHSNSIAYSSTYYYAYPTTMTDAGSNSSTVQYDFDTGAVKQTQGPPPDGQSAAATQTMTYDSVGRLQRIDRSDGWWRYIAYADRGDAVMSQVSIAEYPTSAWSITVVDGADRTRLVGHDLPNSTGGYAGAFTLYDNMGRVSQQSNVEETNAYWSPAGDDSAGWNYTTQTYDWKGRPLVTTAPDNTTKEAIYGGCGCAGGAVVVTRDEVGRRQKTTFDPLGRLKKHEILYEQSKSTALDGTGTVYSTTENTFDALDHVTQVTQADNATSAYQTTTMTFDGYGRLASKHVPEQNSGTATTYSYFDDDTIHVVTDARGATATYAYYDRHLVHTITYGVPSGSSISVPGTVTFDYDAAGNRTSMTDGIGSVSYSYDTLSRLTSETRSITDLSTSYTLSYSYNLGGELTGLTDNSMSTTVTYSYDGIGRLTAVGGSGFSSLSTFASNFEYRAWGAIKAFDYGNSVHQAVGFNSRQQLTSNTFSNVHKGSNSSATIASSYEYFDDGRNSHVTSGIDNKFDRAYTYDHAGRLHEALTGSEARGGTTADGPYKQTYSYDVWTNTTSLTSRIWTQNNSDSGNFTNNRRQYWSYDADGHATDVSNDIYSYDVTAKPTYYAAGWVGSYRALEVATSYDGGGASAKQITTTTYVLYDENNEPQYSTDETTKYYLRSTALGGKVIGEIAPDGGRMSNHVYAGGMELAQPTVSGYATWQHTDPLTGSSFVTDTSRTFGAQKEIGTLGEDVTTAPPASPTMPAFLQPVWPAEYTWGPSAEYLKANADRADEMHQWVQDREAAGNAERAAKHGDRSKIEEIQHKNPNVVPAPGSEQAFNALMGGLTINGTPGYGTMECHCCDDQGNSYPVPTSYSGTDDVSFAPVSFASLAATMPQDTEEKRFTAAVTELKSRLKANKGKNSCAKFFGGLKNAEKKLTQMIENHVFGPTGIEGAAAVTVGSSTIIDQYGPFMDNTGSFDIRVTPQQNYITLNNVSAAAFFLAHELGHRANKLREDSPDVVGKEGSKIASWMNNGDIRTACFSEAKVMDPKK